MRKKVIITPSIFALQSFVKEIPKCLNCKKKLIFKPIKKINITTKKINITTKKQQSKLKFNDNKTIKEEETIEDIIKYDKGNICYECESKGFLEIKKKETYKSYEDLKTKQNDCLEKCYECQGYRTEVICSNYNACDTFWEKIRNVNEIDDLTKIIKNLNF